MMWVLLLGCCLAGPAVTAIAPAPAPEPFIDPASRQLYDYRVKSQEPTGILTTPNGNRVDIRTTSNMNAELMDSEYQVSGFLALDAERIPERMVHARGAGAFGYYEVLTDMSKYTKADVFRGVGKKTPIACRFSAVIQGQSGSDLDKETRGMAIKYYTNEGNLDLIALHFPVYFYRDPTDFIGFAHSFKKNPKTFLYDSNARADFATLRPDVFNGVLWLLSDFATPRGYRKMDGYIQHTLELYNQHGEKYYARINYRTQQGLANFTAQEAALVKGLDNDWFVRDLYNAIERKDYPSWLVEWYIMTEKEIRTANFDPFDLTKFWPEGSYKTVISGRLVLNKNPDNYFEQVEQVAFSPGNLVSGITGAPDAIYQARKLAYIDSARNRLGINVNHVAVNQPKYTMPYTRDGVPYVRNNFRDIPSYFPNSFNGPQPFIDEGRPSEILKVRHTNAVDLMPAKHFYRRILKSEGERQRLVDSIATLLVTVIPEVRERLFVMLELADKEMGQRTRSAFELAVARTKLIQSQETAQDQADKVAAQERNKQLQEELERSKYHPLKEL